MAGDYERFRRIHKAVSANLTILAGVDPSASNIIACPANHTIFIQRIVIPITTDNAATLTFRDNAGTPVIIAVTKASPGIGPIVHDFGADGIPLTEAKGLDLAASGAGLAGRVHVSGYAKLTAVVGDH